MDGGFRVPRPEDRRVSSSRPVPAHRAAEEPTPAKEVPVTASRASAPQRHAAPQKKSKKWLTLPIIVIAILLLAAAGWFGWSQLRSAGPAIDSNKYQAVFFTNGQVYFGKLSSVDKEYLKLTDIFYLQSQQTPEATDSENPQTTSTKQDNVQLIKLGNEVHGPEDKMVISKDQVLFYENIKTEGKVAQSIQNYKKTK